MGPQHAEYSCMCSRLCVIDRGSTGSRGSVGPHFFEWGSSNGFWPPTFSCQNLQFVLFYGDTQCKYRYFPECKFKDFHFWKPKTRNFNVPSVLHSAHSLFAMHKWLKVATDHWSVKWPRPTFGSRDQQCCLTRRFFPHRLTSIFSIGFVSTAVAVGGQFNRDTVHWRWSH